MRAINLLPKLIRAALSDDKKNVEEIALLIGKSLKKEFPQVSTEILQVIANCSVGADVLRSIELEPVPVDRETRSQLVKLEESIVTEEPILEEGVQEQINNFLLERKLLNKFLEEDVIPPNSMLLYGKPGVGKTFIAKWLSYKLHIPMITVDLASSISSYLGRTGQNLKSIFEYAKTNNVILFLDELDAIAKTRDDSGDLGELKRLVNVLLKELDDCPTSCIVIGATNYPEMLDKAIWRRFDRGINVPLPGKQQRLALVKRSLGKWYIKMNDGTINFLVESTVNLSAADICKLCEHIKRQIIINDKEVLDVVAIKECCRLINIVGKEKKKQLCKDIKSFMKSASVRDISNITGISSASVNRYLKE